MLKTKNCCFCILIIIFQLMSCNILAKGAEIAEVSTTTTAGLSKGTTKQDGNKTSPTQNVSSSTPSATTLSLPTTTNTTDSNSLPKLPRTPVNNTSVPTTVSESNISVSVNGTTSKTTVAKPENTTEAQTGVAVTNKTRTSDINVTATTPVPVPPSNNTYSIFFVNDLQYDIFPVHPDNGSVCEAHNNVTDCVGGIGRLKTYILSKMKNNPNSLSLNAGNTLGGQWFKFLKYGTALEAINFLNFSATTVGPEVFEYGKEAGMDFLGKLISTVVMYNIDNVVKPTKIFIGTCNVSVIGFMDDNPTFPDGVTVTNVTQAIAEQINLTRSSNAITIALGRTTREKAKILANSIDGIGILLYSGNCTPTEGKDNTTDYFCWDRVDKKDNTSTYIYSLGMNHSDMIARFLVGELQMTLGNNCKIVNVSHSEYNYYEDNDTDYQWTSNLIQLSGIAHLDDKLTENTKNLSGDTQSCSHTECSLGDLIADCMVAVFGHNMWSKGAARLAVFPAAMLQHNTTLPKGNITAKELYNLTDDAYLYTVALTGFQLSEMLRISLNSSHQGNSTDFLHVSSLLRVKYNRTASNTSNIISIDTVLDTSNTMSLQAINITNNDILYNITVPYTLLHMDSYKKLFIDVNATYHNVTVIQGVISLVNNTGFLTLPVVGDRQQEIEPIVVKPVPDCPSYEGTTILVTLVVTALVLGACYGIWWYIFKRRRGRSGSTMAMMNLDYGSS